MGPFLHLVLADPAEAFVVLEGTPGALWVGGIVTDGAGDPVGDALVETWQADAAGRFDHDDDPRGAAVSTPPDFGGFGRCATNGRGAWAIHTLKPGRVPVAPGRLQAPHIAVSIFARGLLDRVVSRLYFGDEVDANATDPVLGGVPANRVTTLLARPEDGGYRWDVRLQGPDETVFFTL